MEGIKQFQTSPGFCSECGTILPLIREKGDVNCFCCKTKSNIDGLEHLKVKYTINFNSLDAYTKQAEDKQVVDEIEDEGPVVDRKCPKCSNQKMSYATLQLRSADEGQTVFYTCTKCKFKESENS